MILAGRAHDLGAVKLYGSTVIVDRMKFITTALIRRGEEMGAIDSRLPPWGPPGDAEEIGAIYSCEERPGDARRK